MNKIKFDRKAVSVELLIAAADVIDSNGSIPVSVTLARAGAQGLADRVQASGVESALKKASSMVEAEYGPAFGWDWMRGQVQAPSNAIKHGKDVNEPETVELAHELAVMLVIAGNADHFRLTKTVIPRLDEFRLKWTAIAFERMSPDGQRRATKNMESLSQQMTDWLHK